MLQVTIERAPSLADQVARQIQDWLADGTLERGRFYSVQQMSDRLDVSRSPVREAMLALHQAGLIEISRNRGFRVVVPTGRDIAEIFAIRLALEPGAAATAARVDGVGTARRLTAVMTRLREAARFDDERFTAVDREFHAVILSAAGNERIAQIIERLRDATQNLGASTAHRSRSLRVIAGEHRPLIGAIRQGDQGAAHEAMREHLTNTGRLLIGQAADDGDADARLAWEELVADGQ